MRPPTFPRPIAMFNRIARHTKQNHGNERPKDREQNHDVDELFVFRHPYRSHGPCPLWMALRSASATLATNTIATTMQTAANWSSGDMLQRFPISPTNGRVRFARAEKHNETGAPIFLAGKRRSGNCRIRSQNERLTRTAKARKYERRRWSLCVFQNQFGSTSARTNWCSILHYKQ